MSGQKKKKLQTAPSLNVRSTLNSLPVPPGSLLDTINNVNGLYLLFSLVFIIQLFVFKDYIFFQKLYLFLDAGGDSYNHYYPAYIHNARYLRTDGIPTWSFYQGMGANVFPGGLSSPFGLILNIIGPDKLGFGIIYVELLKMGLTGGLFYLYLRRLNFTKYTSVAGGMMASFLGYLVLGSSGWYGHSANVVYFVLLLYSFELFYTKNNWFMVPIAVFFIGDPFKLYLNAVFLLTYSLLRLLTDQRFTFTESIVFLLKLAGLGLIGMGIGCVFSFNELFEMVNSPRVSGDVKATGSLLSVPIFGLADRFQGVTALMRLFSSDLLGTGSDYSGWKNYLEAPVFYSGLVSLLLAPQIFLLGDKRKRAVFAGFLLFWLVPVVFPFFRYALYAFMGDYYKHGLSLFIPFLLLFFALNGLEAVQKKNKANSILLFITFLFLLTILYFPFFDGTPYAGKNIIDNKLRVVISSFLFLYTGLLFFLRFEKLRPYIKCLFLIVLCVELAYFTSITVNQRKTLTIEQFESREGYNDYAVDAVSYLKSVDDGFYRINKDYSSSPAELKSINDAKAQGFYGTPSYSSFNKQEYIDFLKATDVIEKGREIETRWAIGLLQRPLLQAVCSVEYNLVKPGDFFEKDAFYKMTYTPVKRFGNIMLMRNKYALPFGFTYDKYLNSKDFKNLSKTQKDMSLFVACVVDEDLPGIERMGEHEMKKAIKNISINNFKEIVDLKKNDSFQMTRFSQKNIYGEISLDKKKLLFFSIPFDEGWHFFDNGQPTRIIQTNIGFMGIILEKGHHRLEIKYSLKYIKPLLFISIFFLITYLFMVSKKIYAIQVLKRSDLLTRKR